MASPTKPVTKPTKPATKPPQTNAPDLALGQPVIYAGPDGPRAAMVIGGTCGAPDLLVFWDGREHHVQMSGKQAVAYDPTGAQMRSFCLASDPGGTRPGTSLGKPVPVPEPEPEPEAPPVPVADAGI